LKIVWSNDPECPSHVREALARARDTRRHVVIVERGGASDAEVQDALQEFLRRELQWLHLGGED